MATVSDEQVVRDRLDLEMLERPHLWPQQHPFPMIYVKRRFGRATDWNQTGPCFKADEQTWIVNAADWDNGGKNVQFQYASAEEIVAAGWKVD